MSGILLLIEGTIRIDDIVEIENQIVQVKEIALRTSRVITRDDNIVIIPNHKFTDENVINWTHNNVPTRFEVEVNIAYNSNLEITRKCLLEATKNCEDIIQLDAYKPFVRLSDFGTSAMKFHLLFWSHNLFRIENTKSDLRLQISTILLLNNIVIPYNQLVVHQRAVN